MDKKKEEKDDNSDILTRFANFVDDNLRIFRVRNEKESFHLLLFMEKFNYYLTAVFNLLK